MIAETTKKSEGFSVKDVTVAKYAKALSHPARVAILKLNFELEDGTEVV